MEPITEEKIQYCFCGGEATDEMIQFEEKTVLDAKNLGIREYLVKPISPIALKKRICNVFGIKERV